ncbi:hypothetical protein [Arthrobacter zhaoguopingii]|uniref:hypothetical protein n=1 Tax=Arthrobacter zhaoguopingii TaxID=2681491 RepID=UPI00135B0440|nr:hypothetical protein [Arthrobacter zhaoguopingii]
MTSEPASSPEHLSGGQGLKNALRRIFDSQIPNYGAYNLVFAAPEEPEEPEQGEPPAPDGTSYVLGYRWKPAELMIAPVRVADLSGAGSPVEINMTNLAHATMWDDNTYEVGTSTGKVFRFAVEDQPVLDVGPGNGIVLEQDVDRIDFDAFMEAFIGLA